MNLILFGFKGCGKTAIGQKVAKKLKRAFFDTNVLIEDIYQLNRKKKISYREIHKEIGPIGFRALEYEAIQSLQDVQNSVISVGDGVMLTLENVEQLKRMGHLIYLMLSKEELKKRVFAEDELPLYLDPKNPESSFERIYEEREEYYRKIPATHIDIIEKSEEEIIDTICDLLNHKKKKEGK
jgi:shikimate kinase